MSDEDEETQPLEDVQPPAPESSTLAQLIPGPALVHAQPVAVPGAPPQWQLRSVRQVRSRDVVYEVTALNDHVVSCTCPGFYLYVTRSGGFHSTTW